MEPVDVSDYEAYRRAIASTERRDRWIFRALFGGAAGVSVIGTIIAAATGTLWAAAVFVALLLLITLGAILIRKGFALDAYGQPVTARDADRVDAWRARDPDAVRDVQDYIRTRTLHPLEPAPGITYTLMGPMLAGSRERAQQLVVDLPLALEGMTVRLYCHSVMAASLSFADELIVEVLVERGAARLEVVLGADGAELAGYLRNRAGEHGVADRLNLTLT